MSNNQAELRGLARAGIQVPRLGLGGAPLGNLYASVDDAQAWAAVEAAVAGGIVYFDTAPLYGFGISEARIGSALAGAATGDSVVVSTKVGRRLRRRDGSWLPAHDLFAVASDLEPYFDWSRDGIRASVEGSLERLRRTRADVLFLHDPPRDEFDLVERVAYPALEELRAEGTVGAVGAAVNVAADAVELLERLDLDCILIAGRLTLLDQSGLPELVPICNAQGVDLIVGGVFNSGVLADPSPSGRFEYAPVDAMTLERVQRLRVLCGAHGVPLVAAALQYPLRFGPVVSVIPGMRSISEVQANLIHFGHPIPPEFWRELDQETIGAYS
jgi:D-threo-aldose 1-dehydrogenase